MLRKSRRKIIRKGRRKIIKIGTREERKKEYGAGTKAIEEMMTKRLNDAEWFEYDQIVYAPNRFYFLVYGRFTLRHMTVCGYTYLGNNVLIA
ncbi:MAG: hypothetical protein JAZ03_10305 [Candidatus Thiodiazotropha taylori]|nr:hypothetical protein [Candidatus Thiodiazotropha taylori]MCW4334318.1 hypothetical protein [Candidatus Thiodiazotropha endolucinida]